MSIRLSNSERQINLALNKASIEEIDAIIQRLTEYRNKVAELSQHESNLLKVLQSNDDMGLVATNVNVSLRRKTFSRLPKYQYDDNGTLRTWAGVGKMPNWLKDLVLDSEGNVIESELEKLLINKKNDVFQYKDEITGLYQTWDGEGKCPKGLQVLLDRGKALDDFRRRAH